MNKQGQLLIISFLFISIIFSAGCVTVEDSVEYSVVFTATWSEETHPDDFPPNPHFSGLIGASHNDNVTFWKEGSLATPGIENMAETGSKNPLINEISTEVINKNALSLISGDGLNPSPGEVSVNFIVSEEYPLVTLVTMIAPSPDWFVGVNSLNLFENGLFVDEKTVVLYAYDAGTDSGLMYTSPNNATDPPEFIYQITGYPFLYDNEIIALGYYTFTKVESI